MLKSIIETAKLIFTSKESNEVDEITKNKHQESEKILFRNLDEITSKYDVSGVYTLNERMSTDGNNVIQYEFQEVEYEVDTFIKKSYKENLGTLIIIDEEKKKMINAKFSLKQDWINSHLLNKSRLSSAPDFVYEIEGQQVWVTLSSIRNQVKEVEHTEMLELLYCALFNTNQIKIDADFGKNGTSIEKYYELVHFRLDRNSFFLIIRDREDKELYHSHEFKHISSFNYSATEDILKVWVDTIDGLPCRLYIPYKKEELYAEHIQIDPIIYRY